MWRDSKFKSYTHHYWSYRGLQISYSQTAKRVCNLLFIYRYMQPEGPWQRLSAAHRANGGFLYNLILAQIRIPDHI